MFATVAYLFFAYVAVGTFSCLIRASLKKQKKARQIITVSLLLLPLLPYAIVAAQTALFGTIMRRPVRQALLDTGMSDGNISGMRVMAITPWESVVEVIEPCTGGMNTDIKGRPLTGQDAQTVTLVRRGSVWRLEDYDTVWSDCGSADGNTFPPYPEGSSL